MGSYGSMSWWETRVSSRLECLTVTLSNSIMPCGGIVPTGAVSLRLSPVQRRATREEIEAAGRSVTINYHAPITIHGTGPDMEHRLAAYHRRHIDQMTRDLEEVVYRRNRSAFDGATAT